MLLQLKNYSIVLLLMIFFIGESICRLDEVRVEVPLLAKSGDSVTLKCDYTLNDEPLYSIKWYWNEEEFFRYVPESEPKELYFPIRNKIHVDVKDSGPNKITLRDVTEEQSGIYHCEVTTDAPYFRTLRDSAPLKVIKSPSNGLFKISGPSIKLSYNNTDVRKTITAECVLNNSIPQPNITWWFNNEKDLTSNKNVKISTYNLQDNVLSRKIEIIAGKSNFIQGVLSLKCEVGVFNSWNRTVLIKLEDN